MAVLTGDNAARNRLLSEIASSLGVSLVSVLSGDDYTRNLLLEQIRDALATGTGTVADNSVTFAKLQDVPTNSIVGRNVSGTGDASALTAEQTRTLLGLGGFAQITFTSITGAFNLTANQGVIPSNDSTRVVATLPATAALGSMIVIVGKGSAGWTLAQRAGQQVIVDGSSTSVGTGGQVQSQVSHPKSGLLLVCTVANLEFTAIAEIGSLSYT